MDTAKKTAVEMLDEARERKCRDVILGITELSIDNHEIIHIHTQYSPHVNGFCVYVYPITEEYVDIEIAPFFRVDFSLNRNRFEDNATPLQQLLELEDKLLALIAEAKDKAGVQA
ncbi:hypothetical protein [Photobacterium sp. TY1-4]|uniref:hypothetical protein n=1 Tax=Photobacterium sp. TY1-4 TaxID=2899122 RepID=UPI0021BF05BF|nr:hypothetical protein [Photobacterium sp. TY1-4]UXI00454.1 hypothetical protein NH461_11600 [Photobacterium sp. TY1-4]